MIIKIWPIKADYASDKSKVGGVEGLKNAYEYITDAEKVIVNRNDLQAMEVLDGNNVKEGPEEIEEGNQRRVLNYMANDEKIEGKYISGYLCDPDNAVSEFNSSRVLTLEAVNRNPKKETGAVAFHIVQSFPEGLSISDEEVHQCGLELCEKLNAYQAVICSHVHPMKDDEGVEHGKCKHNHILINAYMHPDKLDPKHPERAKYNDCNASYAQLRAWNDEIAIDHGLPIIRNPDDERTYSWKESDEINKGTSWKQRIRLDIEDARRASGSWEEFVHQMEEVGYKIKDGAHVSYVSPDGKHTARGKKLGRQYTKDSLERYWSYRNFIYSNVDQEVKLNDSPPLLDLVLATKEPLRAAIPVGMKNQENRPSYYLPLEKVPQSSEVLATYFNENELYDICDENNQPVAAVTGREIIACMEQLRKGREQLLEDRRNPAQEKEKAARDAEEQKKKDYYTYVLFVNSRTRKPYRTSLYDKNGRRRSILELMFLLAITVLRKEEGLWERDYTPTDKEGDPIFAPRSWKIQNMIDSIYIAQEEQIDTLAQLDQRLKEAGASFSRAKSALKKTTRAKEKMETLNGAVKAYRKTAALAQSILDMPDGTEKDRVSAEYKNVLEQYKAAKAVLYQYKVTTEEEIVDFEDRYKKIQTDIKELDNRLDQAKEEYRKLKKLSYNLELAQNSQYCYGPEYNREYFYQQEQEYESDEARNNRAEQSVDERTQNKQKDLNDREPDENVSKDELTKH